MLSKNQFESVCKIVREHGPINERLWGDDEERVLRLIPESRRTTALTARLSRYPAELRQALEKVLSPAA